MKTKKEQSTAIVRNKYTPQFKEQALERAVRDGIPAVAKDLGACRIDSVFMAGLPFDKFRTGFAKQPK